MVSIGGGGSGANVTGGGTYTITENEDGLLRRMDEAAAFAGGMDRLAISPQCGFASTMGGNPVTEADERAKLRLCVEAARAIWG